MLFGLKFVFLVARAGGRRCFSVVKHRGHAAQTTATNIGAAARHAVTMEFPAVETVAQGTEPAIASV